MAGLAKSTLFTRWSAGNKVIALIKNPESDQTEEKAKAQWQKLNELSKQYRCFAPFYVMVLNEALKSKQELMEEAMEAGDEGAKKQLESLIEENEPKPSEAEEEAQRLKAEQEKAARLAAKKKQEEEEAEAKRKSTTVTPIVNNTDTKKTTNTDMKKTTPETDVNKKDEYSIMTDPWAIGGAITVVGLLVVGVMMTMDEADQRSFSESLLGSRADAIAASIASKVLSELSHSRTTPGSANLLASQRSSQRASGSQARSHSGSKNLMSARLSERVSVEQPRSHHSGSRRSPSVEAQ